MVVLVSVGATLAAAQDLPAARPLTPPYLDMPEDADGMMPALLSQTGAFAPGAAGGPPVPVAALIPYEVNTPLWTDGARKQRWIAVPQQPAGDDALEVEERIGFAATGTWYFPRGTVLAQEFALPRDERAPGLRRLETRLLVCSSAGHVYGVTYRWRADGSDAELCDAAGADEDVAVVTRSGGTRTQRWRYPSRAECLICHNPVAGGVLGVSTRQLNRPVPGPGGAAVPQLAAWGALGLFRGPFATDAVATYPRLAALDDAGASVEERVRSYLDANCSHCHRPGVMAFQSYDARYETPLEQQNLIQGHVLTDYGIERPRYIKPRDPWRSMVLVRQERTDLLRMPPFGRTLVDGPAMALLRAWIDGLPGAPALAPPEIEPAGGRLPAPITVRAHHADPAAELHFTLDGSAPDEDSPRWTGPLLIERATVLRVKAYRPGWSGSLPVVAEFTVR